MKKCLCCKQEIEPWAKDYPDQMIMGGHIRVCFGFGSRYDHLGLRGPKYHCTDPILKDKPGYHERDAATLLSKEPNKELEGIKVYIPDETAEVESVPREVPKDRQDLKVASNRFIKAYICDDCFEKNIDLFEGSEEE